MSEKSNFNIGSIIIIIILLQLGVRGYKEINKKVKMKKRSEAFQLCMKETNDAFKCKNPLRNSKRFKDIIEKLKKEDKLRYLN
tara:strand:+ start:178 stop:426 length:249 start_codon:yes stop_codon:yes gene_type:complete